MNKTHLLIGLGIGILAVSATSVVFAANNNYGNWLTMMGNNGRAASVVTEKNFGQFAEMHRLMANGDYAGAQKIRTSLGIGQGRGNGAGCGMNGGNGQGANCPRHSQGAGQGVNFTDLNKNGICDHLEETTQK